MIRCDLHLHSTYINEDTHSIFFYTHTLQDLGCRSGQAAIQLIGELQDAKCADCCAACIEPVRGGGVISTRMKRSACVYMSRSVYKSPWKSPGLRLLLLPDFACLPTPFRSLFLDLVSCCATTSGARHAFAWIAWKLSTTSSALVLTPSFESRG